MLEIDLPDPRLNAAHALGQMGKEAAPAVETLIDLMLGSEPDLARLAIDALAAIGPHESANGFSKTLESRRHQSFTAASGGVGTGGLRRGGPRCGPSNCRRDR